MKHTFSICIGCCVVIPIILGFYNYKYLSKSIKPVFYALTLSGIVDAIATYYLFKNINYNWLTSFTILIDFCIMIYFFKINLPKAKYIFGLFLIGITFWIIEKMFVSVIMVYGYFGIVARIIFMYLVIKLFVQFIIKNTFEFTNAPMFYIILAIMADAFFRPCVDLFRNPIFGLDIELRNKIWIVASISCLINYTFISIGFYKTRYKD